MIKGHATFDLAEVLDELRDAYEVAKVTRHTDLQARLMHARRTVLTAIHHCLELYSEIADLQEQLGAARAENGRTEIRSVSTDSNSRRVV
jgi:hypothetical protein